MSQDGERARPLGFAVARYKQGKCPSCEKKLGESRGTSRLLRRLGPRGNHWNGTLRIMCCRRIVTLKQVGVYCQAL